MSFAKNWMFNHSVTRRVKDGYFENDGIRQHYVTLGEGDLVVFIHGIPEFWYSWRHQIEALSKHYQVVALDQRGFNESGKPASKDGYRVEKLVKDVAALIKHLGRKQAVIVGHDAGAWLAWHFAALHPELTERLIILSVPHPNAMCEELAEHGAQHRASEYARKMQKDGAKPMFRTWQISLLLDRAAFPLYLAADRGTDPEAITSFYQFNYPREPYALDETLPLIEAPTLVIHGKRDRFLLASGHEHNARWLKHEPKTVMLDADHFVHQEKPDDVNKIILDWLK
ncbi:MAG TPA: alpha/beta hydrolase [Anaerolineales bacterium]|nr:alpha/beta hydrolase [Anaerolineales bacterium]